MRGEKRSFFFAQMIAGMGGLISRYREFEEAEERWRLNGDGDGSQNLRHENGNGRASMSEENKVLNVLFLCTHNSARSILAEAILNNLAVNGGRFQAFSAGSHPSGKPNPFALECISNAGLPTAGLRSKDWAEFAQPGAPALDFVFTVCDNAANEVCPVWPGQPMSAHWGLPDPAAVEGSDDEKRKAFSATFRHLSARIGIFTSLPMSKLDKMSLQNKLNEIGKA